MSTSTTGQLATSGASAKLVDGDATAPTVVTVVNHDASINVFVAYVTATTANGILVGPGKSVVFYLDAGETLNVIAASGTPTVSYARARAQQRQA